MSLNSATVAFPKAPGTMVSPQAGELPQMNSQMAELVTKLSGQVDRLQGLVQGLGGPWPVETAEMPPKRDNDSVVAIYADRLSELGYLVRQVAHVTDRLALLA